MGTRGAVGFRIDEQDKLTYNHYDSYPDELGQNVLDFIHSVENWDEVKEKVRQLEDVSNREPTEQDIERLQQFANLNVGNQTEKDWYCLLRETQGDLDLILLSGVFVSANNFINDSLFCEYAYIVNLDDMTLEFYEGSQEAPHYHGRYADFVPEKREYTSSTYYACALMKTFPLKDCPEDASVFESED